MWMEHIYIPDFQFPPIFIALIQFRLFFSKINRLIYSLLSIVWWKRKASRAIANKIKKEKGKNFQ